MFRVAWGKAEGEKTVPICAGNEDDDPLVVAGLGQLAAHGWLW